MPTVQIYLSEGDLATIRKLALEHGGSEGGNDTMIAAGLMRAIARGQVWLSSHRPVVEAKDERPGCPFQALNKGGHSDAEMALVWLHMLSEEVEVLDLIDFLNGLLPERKIGESTE